MSAGFSITTNLNAPNPLQYWSIGEGENVVHVTTANSATVQDWSIKSGILYNRGRQVYYDVQTNRLTLRSPIASQSFPSPMVMEPCTGSCGNTTWSMNVTSTYAVQNTSSPQVSFQTNTIAVPQTYRLPLMVVMPGVAANGSYPTGGNPFITPQSSATLRTGIFQLNQVTPNGLVPIPLNGLAPLVDLGSVVPGTTKTVNNQPPPTSTGWWPYVLVIGLIIIGALLIWIVTRKKKEVIPIASDPLVLAAVMKR